MRKGEKFKGYNKIANFLVFMLQPYIGIHNI